MSVRYAILGLLSQKPRHGYELRAAFSALVGGDENWDVKPGQIYTTLYRLNQAGLVQLDSVSQSGGPEKQVYAITNEGKQLLKEWYESGVSPENTHDEFFIKLMTALVSGDIDPVRLIQTQRAYLYQDLHAATNSRNEYDPQTEMAQILLMDKTIMHLEADLRWLDMTEMRIEVVKKQPIPEPPIKSRGRPKKTALKEILKRK